MAETTTTTDDFILPKERLELVVDTNHEISMLAEGITRLLDIERNDDFLIYHGMLARIQQLSNIQFYALRLHGETGEKELNSYGKWDTDVGHLAMVYRGTTI